MIGRALLAVSLSASASAVSAQLPSPPTPIESGAAVRGSAAASGEDGVVGCYAIATRAGQRLSVTLAPSGFSGEVRIARGALCNANAVQARRAWTGAGPVELDMAAGGGRYLVLVARAAGTGGSYRLTVTAGEASAAAAPPAATVARAEPQAAPTALPPQMSARRQLMLAQMEQRRLQLAEQAEQRRQQEEVAREQRERNRLEAEREEAQAAAMRANQPDVGALIVGGFMQGFNEQMARNNEAAREDAAYSRRLQAMESEHRAREQARQAQSEQAAARTAAQRRVAQQNLAAAQQRMRDARQQQAAAGQGQSGAGGPAAGGSAGAATGNRAAARYYFAEELAYCSDMESPLDGWTVRCSFGAGGVGPDNFANDRAFLDRIRPSCGARLTATRPVNNVSERVYGCGYGANVRRSARNDFEGTTDIALRRIYACDGPVARCDIAARD